MPDEVSGSKPAADFPLDCVRSVHAPSLQSGVVESPAEELVKILLARGKTIAAAESCTAGLCSALIAEIPGASKVFWGAFVTYTAESKIKTLGVPEVLVNESGAVSRPVAAAMAEGALKVSGASAAFSVTGLAGPCGDGSGVPVGTVWIGLAVKRDAFRNGENDVDSEAKEFIFNGSRNEVRRAAALKALEEIRKKIEAGSR